MAGLLGAATVNPLMARQFANARQNVTAPTSVMDERYPAWKKSQDQATQFLLAADLIGSAVPAGLLAAPAMKKGLLSMGETVAKAPREEALRIAQLNAAKPKSEGGLGLPTNNTPMDRAKAMGFRESGYHGTAKEIESYDPSKAMGAGSGSREGPLGAWLADDPRVASGFANWSARGQGGDVVYPMMIRGDKAYEPAKYSDIKDIVDANTKFFRPDMGVRMVQDKVDIESAKKQLESLGDYVALRNTQTDAIDRPITQFLVTDPSRLRSRFAAFDPARKMEADILGYADPRLLAGIGGAGLLGAYKYRGQE